MKTVLELLNQAAEKHYDVPYVCQKTDAGWDEKTFKDVDDESAFLAKGLISKDIKKGDRIALLAEGRENWITGEFGVLKAGAISVPLSIKLKEEEIPFRLNHSGASAILVSENTLPKIAGILDLVDHEIMVILLNLDTMELDALLEGSSLEKGRNLFLYSDLVDMGKNSDSGLDALYQSRLEEIEEDDVVTISYTSGTTGNPKGIMLTHKNYYTNSLDATKVFTIPRGSRSLIILPLDHSFAHTVGIYISLIFGLSMYFVDARGGGMAILRNIPINLKQSNPYFLLTVPALSGNFMKKMKAGIEAKGGLIEKIFSSGVEWGIKINGDGYNKTSILTRILGFLPYKLASSLIFPKLKEVFGNNIAFCVGGGALLEIKQQEFFNAIGVPVYQGYGLTEAAPIICANTPQKHKFGTSGAVFPSIECRIMADDETEAAPGKAGEIVIHGDNVMKGYYRNEEATNEVLRDGWLWTGDLGYFDEDGFLVVTGRAKALLISSDGEKYSPEEIEEAVINNSSLVNQVMAHNEQNKFTIALVTPNVDILKKQIKEKGITSAKGVLELLEKDFYAFRENGSSIPSQWIPSCFALVAKEFSEEDGLINSTMKLVRHKVRDFYIDRINDMYEGAPDNYSQLNRDAAEEFLK